MNKKHGGKEDAYPVELPPRKEKASTEPITDVVETEIFPLELNHRHGSGAFVPDEASAPENNE